MCLLDVTSAKSFSGRHILIATWPRRMDDQALGYVMSEDWHWAVYYSVERCFNANMEQD